MRCSDSKTAYAYFFFFARHQMRLSCAYHGDICCSRIQSSCMIDSRDCVSSSNDPNLLAPRNVCECATVAVSLWVVDAVVNISPRR